MAAGSAGMLLHISPALSAITLSVVPATVLGAAGYSRVVKRLSRELLNQLASSTQVRRVFVRGGRSTEAPEWTEKNGEATRA